MVSSEQCGGGCPVAFGLVVTAVRFGQRGLWLWCHPCYGSVRSAPLHGRCAYGVLSLSGLLLTLTSRSDAPTENNACRTVAGAGMVGCCHGHRSSVGGVTARPIYGRCHGPGCGRAHGHSPDMATHTPTTHGHGHAHGHSRNHIHGHTVVALGVVAAMLVAPSWATVSGHRTQTDT